MELKDKKIFCHDCGSYFIFSVGEQEFYLEKGFTNEPVRCLECRHLRKVERNNHRRFDQKYVTDKRNVIDNYVIEKGSCLENSILYIPILTTILPPTKFVEDITIINNSLLEKAYKNPSVIHELSSRQFEELVCELLSKQGYNVTLTQKTKDGGKDILVIENKFIGGFVIYVECKKYRPDRPVGVNLVRELYGTISIDNVTAGMLVTSSYFSKEAITQQEKIKHRMGLVDYEVLTQKIQEVCFKD